MNSAATLAYGEQLLRQMQSNPSSGAAFHSLAIVAIEHGNNSEAINLLAHAIHLDGPIPQYCATLAEAFAKAGDFSRAATCLAQALEGDPKSETLRLAYANILHLSGNHLAAAVQYELIARVHPDHAEAWFNLGVVRTILGDIDAALDAYRNAVHARPHYPEAWNNLALLEYSRRDYNACEASYRRALLVNPDYQDALYNFAFLLQEQERLQEAVSVYERLIARNPEIAEAQNNLGNTYLKLNRIADAQRCYQETLALNASHKEAPWNLGFASLLAGDYAQGWVGYEQRLAQHEIERREWSVPRWNGRLVPGQRILVHHEQGLGDTIQFARYLPLLSRSGMLVEVLCQKPLVSLFEGTPGVVLCSSDPDAFTPGDWQVPFPSLGYHFRTRLDNIPNQVPYLMGRPDRLENWQQLFAQLPPAKLRVGLAWQGNPLHRNDHNRSLPVSFLNELLDIEDCQFLSLQKGAAPASIPSGIKDLGPLLVDFADTAAAVQCLDLVISVDTSVTHLAGAFGRPTWTLLPYSPDWRWLLHRSDSPWYPSMRLFRQPVPGDWASVMREVKREIVSLREAGSRS